MGTITFDTHEFVKRPRDSGLSESQAETITDLQRQSNAAAIEQTRQNYPFDSLATQRDLKDLELKIEGVRTDLKHDLKELEQRMVIKLGGLMVVAVGAVATLVKLL